MKITWIFVISLITTVVFAQETVVKPPVSIAEEKMAAIKFQAVDEGEYLLYRQYSPSKIEPGKKYPLVIFMHGLGERGSDNKKQLVHCADDFIKYMEKHNQPAFFIMPQCRGDMRWVRYIKPLRAESHKMDRYPTLPLQMAEQLIDTKIEELPIDQKRVYIAGLSMGGFATWELISRRPELFAAALPICGGGDPKYANKFKQVAVWAFHGDSDSVVPANYSSVMIDALKKAKAPQVKYTEYPGVGHNSWTQTTSNEEVLQWLFKQSK